MVIIMAIMLKVVIIIEDLKCIFEVIFLFKINNESKIITLRIITLRTKDIF